MKSKILFYLVASLLIFSCSKSDYDNRGTASTSTPLVLTQAQSSALARYRQAVLNCNLFVGSGTTGAQNMGEPKSSMQIDLKAPSIPAETSIFAGIGSDAYNLTVSIRNISIQEIYNGSGNGRYGLIVDLDFLLENISDISHSSGSHQLPIVDNFGFQRVMSLGGSSNSAGVNCRLDTVL